MVLFSAGSPSTSLMKPFALVSRSLHQSAVLMYNNLRMTQHVKVKTIPISAGVIVDPYNPRQPFPRGVLRSMFDQLIFLSHVNSTARFLDQIRTFFSLRKAKKKFPSSAPPEIMRTTESLCGRILSGVSRGQRTEIRNASTEHFYTVFQLIVRLMSKVLKKEIQEGSSPKKEVAHNISVVRCRLF